MPDANNPGRHQRHQLVSEIAARQDRHLILLTATPHSGIEGAFRSLLALLRPHFADWDTSALSEPQRIELAKHFVQRTRRDIEKDWEGEHCFPRRESREETYGLSPAYKKLFEKTYQFCKELVSNGSALDKRRQRVRYWGVLALLRCVMSSPAAAVAALESRRLGWSEGDDETDFHPYVFESDDDRTDDDQPTPPVEAAEATLGDAERRRLRDLGRMAKGLLDSPEDTKLARCVELIDGLLREGFHPIIWCRYIATADYVASGLQKALAEKHPNVRVVSITGRMADDERRAKVDELAEEPCRVLVATDCLSEGINLQEAFNAVLHYDLPWNPNRLEQREGRVDRYGQTSKVVKVICYFSPDSPVDGVVLDVLLKKAREIHRTLGTYVPVPGESETVTEALLKALFLRGSRTAKTADETQLTLAFGEDEIVGNIASLHRRWDSEAERERVNRTRFAQRALKPDEVRKELEATDAVLGDPDAVKQFVLSAAQGLNLPIQPDRRPHVFRVVVNPNVRAELPAAIASVLPTPKSGQWLVSFTSPTPEGAEYLGRNHRFVAALARFIMEEALTRGGAATATRCGVIKTRAVSRLTTLLLLRVRYLICLPERAPLLAEEVMVAGFIYRPGSDEREWLSDGEALRLLAEARPDANLPLAEKRELVQATLAAWPTLEPDIRQRIAARAAELEKSHKRIRQAVSLKVRQLNVDPQFPPDLLGILVLQPVVQS